MSGKPCLAAAIDYLKLGWSAIPLCPHDHAGVPGAHEHECKTPGKRPLWPWKDTIKPRLEAAGANEDRLINLRHVTIKGEERPVEIPGDLFLIAQKIKDNDARLLIIDPLFAFLY